VRRAIVAAILFVGAAAVLGGCVDTHFREGLPCTRDRRCPPDQTCYTVGQQALCLAKAPPDAAPALSEPDAPPSEPDAAVPDAPPPDAPLPDAPLPDAPLPDAPVPDAAIPDAPIPDAPQPDAPPCDPLQVQTCALGTGCQWHSTAQGGPKCETSGTLGNHSACTTSSQCQPGFTCTQTLLGTECVPYCRVGNACGAPLDSCMALDSTVGTCEFAGCDPLTQNCGQSTEACAYDPMRGGDVCDPNPGSGEQGDACSMTNKCAKTFQCFMCASGTPRCGRFCDVSDGNPGCADLGVACRVLMGNVGVCDPCL
jgi:hypothetical protein